MMSKRNMVVALSALACVGFTAQGVELERPGQVQKEQKMVQGKRDFGTYRIVSGLRAQTEADRQQGVEAVAQVAGTPVVQVSGNVILARGAVVEDMLSGRKGLVTGRLSVLAEKGADLAAKAKAMGLSVSMSDQKLGLYLLEAPDNVELRDLKTELSTLQGVKQVKIDVLDNRNVEY